MKLTIKGKLIGGFSLVLALMLIAAVIAVSNLSGMNNLLNGIVEKSAQKVNLAGDINQNLLEISRAEKNLILADTQERMQQYGAFIESTLKQMKDRQENLKNLSDEQGKGLLDQFGTVWDDFMGVHKQVKELAFLNSNVKAKALSQGSAREAYDQAAAAIANIVQKNKAAIDSNLNAAALKDLAHKINLAAEVDRNLLEIQRAEKNMILATSEENMAEYAKAIENVQRNLTESLDALDKIALDSEKVDLRGFRTQYNTFLDLDKKVQELTLQNGNARAFALASSKGRELADKAQDMIEAIITKNQKDMERDKGDSDKNYTSARNMLFGVAAVSLLIGIGLAFWIITGITQGLAYAQAVTNAVADGDLTREIKNTSQDEIGNLLQCHEENGRKNA